MEAHFKFIEYFAKELTNTRCFTRAIIVIFKYRHIKKTMGNNEALDLK